MIDSIECDCGARTAIGFLDKEGKVFFIGGSYKNHHVKTSINNESSKRCLWCGHEWPENVKLSFSKLAGKK